MPVTFEMQDNVDQVLKRARPGDRSVLGDMPDQHDGQRLLFRHRHQGGGDLPDLGYPAGRAVDVRRGDGLHRVDDQQARADCIDVAEHGGQICLGGEEEQRADGADPVSAESHLCR